MEEAEAGTGGSWLGPGIFPRGAGSVDRGLAPMNVTGVNLHPLPS